MHFITLDRLDTLLVFFVLHLLYGALRPAQIGYKPFFWKLMESASVEIDRRLNKETYTDYERYIRGIVAVVLMSFLGFLIGAAVHRIGMYPYGWVAHVLLLGTCVAVMQPLKTIRMAIKNIKTDLPASIGIIQSMTFEDLTKADNHTIMRKCIELLAVWVNVYLMGPVFFYILCGPIGLVLYVTVTALCEAFGLPDRKHLSFGRFVRFLENIVNAIPARLSVLLMMVASLFVSKSGPWRAFKLSWGQSKNHIIHNKGIVVATMAGALGVTLAGPVKYSPDYTMENKWIGPKKATAKTKQSDVNRALMLFFVVFLCFMVSISVKKISPEISHKIDAWKFNSLMAP